MQSLKCIIGAVVGLPDRNWGHSTVFGLSGGTSAFGWIPGEGLRCKRPCAGQRWHECVACSCPHGTLCSGGLAGELQLLQSLCHFSQVLLYIWVKSNSLIWIFRPPSQIWICPVRIKMEPQHCTSPLARATIALWSVFYSWEQKSWKTSGVGPPCMMQRRMENWRCLSRSFSSNLKSLPWTLRGL